MYIKALLKHKLGVLLASQTAINFTNHGIHGILSSFFSLSLKNRMA